MKILVLGLGNEILCDDAVGIRVARELENRGRIKEAEFRFSDLCGLAVAESLVGFDLAFIIDAILTGEVETGFVFKLHPEEIKETMRLAGLHDMNLKTALHLLSGSVAPLPKVVSIYAIEALDTISFSEKMSPILEEKLEMIVDRIQSGILEDIDRYADHSI
jgi:hydrogenase maturation protease